MLDKHTRKELAQIAKGIDSARKALATYEAQYAALRLKAIRTVEMTKVGETITLEAGNRVIKAKKYARYNDRWSLTEHGKSIAKEYFGSIHDIRFNIAMGQI
jgi:cystathionine beta-lyase family protein involved in aluminum resistance